jgi:transposase
MIAADKRKAIFLLHQEGVRVRQIARQLRVSRNTVRAVIAQQGSPPLRRWTPPIDPDLLRRLFDQCEGYVQRVHEKLQEEHGQSIKYSTLSGWLRRLGISRPAQTRCEHVPDEPGAEMQHDTSPMKVLLGQSSVPLQASLLYLRYSKRRYLQFYRAFNRFRMKCFLHRALMHWSYAPKICVIDNTNLARLRGVGAQALINPEMEAFAKMYGFRFLCHAPKHSDRKAGDERSFATVLSNFLPGRTFENLEDLNRQALDWSTVRLEQRPQGKAGLIPAQAFEHERAFLQPLSAHLPAPYLVLVREVDEYGYVALEANYYWVPGTDRGQVTVLRYDSHLQIHQHGQCLIQYPLPPDGVKNKPFAPCDKPPHHAHPRHHKPSSQIEEARLRALDPSVAAYLDWVLTTPGLQRHQYLRRLLVLSQQMTPELFVASVQRAHRYRVPDLATLEQIARLSLKEGIGYLPAPPIDESFRDRPAYLEGALTDPPDLSQYDE